LLFHVLACCLDVHLLSCFVACHASSLLLLLSFLLIQSECSKATIPANIDAVAAAASASAAAAASASAAAAGLIGSC
jgi:hypothetical protein